MPIWATKHLSLMSVSVVFPLYFPFGRGLPLGLSSAVPSSVSLPFNGNGKKTAAPKSKTEPGTANPRPPQKQENVDNTVCLAVVVVSGGGFRSGKKWKHARTHTHSCFNFLSVRGGCRIFSFRFHVGLAACRTFALGVPFRAPFPKLLTPGSPNRSALGTGIQNKRN